MIRDDQLERDIIAFLRTKAGPVSFQFDYLPLRICHFLTARAIVHGSDVMHFRYISSMSVEDIKQEINELERNLLTPGRYLVIRMDKRLPGQPLDECDLFTITEAGFEPVVR